jgi:hypothetical protein
MLADGMRSKGVPEQYVAWMERKLAGRRTVLCFDDYESETFDITHGIDQGCPLSCIFYLSYNSALIEIAGKYKGTRAELVLGFIDDVALMARGRDAGEAMEGVKNMMERR